MANRYWVGGTGGWSDTAHWSTTSGGSGGASVPGTADVAFFDANSGTGFTTTISSSTTILGLDHSASGTVEVSSGVTLTVSNASTLSCKVISAATLNLVGSLTVTTSGGSSTLTLTGSVTGSGSILATTGTSGTINFSGGGNTLGNVTLGSIGTTKINLLDAFSCANLTIRNGNGSVAWCVVKLSGDITVSSSLTVNSAASGNAYRARTLIASDTDGTQRTISVGSTTANGDGFDFRDIAISGATFSGTAVGDCHNNSGITFTTPKTVYWVGGSYNWGTQGSLCFAASSGGTAAGANFPNPQDTLVVDNNSGAASSTISIGNGYNTTVGVWCVCNVDCSARTNAITFSISGTTAPVVNGNFTASNSVTMASGTLEFRNTSSKTFVSSSLSRSTALKITPAYSALTFSNATNSTSSITVDGSATFSAGGSEGTLTCNSGSSISLTGTLTLSNSFTGHSGITVSSGTIAMTSASAKTFAGAGGNYSGMILNNGGAGALIISGSNSFANITNSVQPTQFTFTSGTTQTVGAFGVSGTSGNLVTITASSTGAATLSKSSGSVVVQYCSIAKSTATGGATWTALFADGNVDGGGNTGWDFGTPVFTGNGLFFGSNF